MLEAGNGQGSRKEWLHKLSHDKYGILNLEQRKHASRKIVYTEVKFMWWHMWLGQQLDNSDKCMVIENPCLIGKKEITVLKRCSSDEGSTKGGQLNFLAENLDANLLELRPLKEFTQEVYWEGFFYTMWAKISVEVSTLNCLNKVCRGFLCLVCTFPPSQVHGRCRQ